MADSDDRDRERTVSLGDTRDLDSTSQGALRHLDDLDGWKLADGTPDVRGWDVKDSGGDKIGKVAGLLVDTGTRKVRYLELELDEDAAKRYAGDVEELNPRDEPLQYVLVPVGVARLNDDDDVVTLDAHASELIDLAYRPGTMPATHDAELQRRFGNAGDRAEGKLRRPSDRELERQPIADFTVIEIEREAGIGDRDRTDPRNNDGRLGL